MTVLVTGATGFVGRRLSEELRAAGVPVRALVREAAAASPLRALGAEILIGDMRDAHAVREAVRGASVVYHCAAAIGQAPKFLPRDIFSINLAGARNLLESLRAEEGARLVLLSSVNVLGTRHFANATEADACRRSGDPSADVKIAIEALASQYQRRHGMDNRALPKD